MKWSYLPPYGHASCPRCRREFDLKRAKPTFLEKAPYNDTLVYVMCPGCHGKFQKGSASKRKVMGNSCFVNLKSYGVTADGGMHPFAVTSTLTLALNSGDLTKAVENGHGLTRAEYLFMCVREFEVSILPEGLRIISTSPQAGADNE